MAPGSTWRRIRSPAFCSSSFFVLLFANHKAERALHGDLPAVEIRLAERDVSFRRVILGTTANYVFTLDPVGRDVAVFPARSLEMIRFELPERRDPGND